MMLVTEGKEHQMLKEILATKDGINQRIGKSNEVNSVLCKEAPRLVPPEFNPQCIETFIEIKNTQPTVSKKTKPKKPEKQPKRNKQSTKTPKKVRNRFLLNCINFIYEFKLIFQFSISGNFQKYSKILQTS